MKESFRLIGISEVQESPLNPRKSFDEVSLAELTASIKDKGIINPLLVRSVNSHFEIIAGARRFRAAKAAGLENIPAIVRELNDEDAMEIMIIENLQRQDVHPLDEADGYARLLKAKNGDVKAMAAKVGKSLGYIYGRLALNNLIDPAKKAYIADQMQLGHALLLSKLQPQEQKDVLNHAIKGQELTIPSLRRYIADEILLELSSAPWKKDDEQLLSRAGSCNACQKRTGFNPELFQDFGKNDKCLDGKCFGAKMEAFLVRKRLEIKKQGMPVRDICLNYYTSNKGVLDKEQYRDWKGCDNLVMGLVVEGSGLGTAKKICITPDCKKCNPGRHVSHNDFARKTAPERYKRRIEIWENKIEQESRIRLRKAVLPLIKAPVKRWHLLALLRETMEARHLGYGESFEEVAKLAGIKWPDTQRIIGGDDIKHAEKMLAKHSDDDILRFIFAIATNRDMISDPSFGRNDIELLTPLIEQHGEKKVDVKQITAAVRTEFEKSKPKPPKEASKKSGKKTTPKAKGKKS